jgi:hypothetical protein
MGGRPVGEERNNEMNKKLIIAELEQALKFINEDNFDSAIWRIVDSVGRLSLKSKDSIGISSFTGLGYKVISRDTRKLPHMQAADTIRDYCKKRIDCEGCDLVSNHLPGNGCQVSDELKCHIDFLKRIKELLHYQDTTINLWATDRPDLLTEEEKKKFHLFELKR